MSKISAMNWFHTNSTANTTVAIDYHHHNSHYSHHHQPYHRHHNGSTACGLDSWPTQQRVQPIQPSAAHVLSAAVNHSLNPCHEWSVSHTTGGHHSSIGGGSRLSSGRSTPSTAGESSVSSAATAMTTTSHVVYEDFEISKKDIQAFRRLLEEPLVEELLLWDKCCLLADKYLLAMALTYFKRAGLRHQQYTPVYLMVALYLAHDMEEDDLDIKLDLVRFAMSGSVSANKLRLFLRKRDKLWHAMGLRAAVNHVCCEALMRYCLPDHKIWRRERAATHGGVCVPAHVKTVVHRELRLTNSYIECNVQCIVCLSHIVMRRRKMFTTGSTTGAVGVAGCRAGPAVIVEPVANHYANGKHFFSTLSAHSAPFIPHNYCPIGLNGNEE
ncbi:unnamed protein product [Medioppia subpectinata]|uniref:Uncharacterized protein n=1 Tax=Medioppia subpectinata TaxID=1979941 RepID=A0A7R9PZ57_9ACAR|nr:unnamed protein product [Medioppia subpectinata]CAG2106635.1 unnamed protein product [Medioppia subpectinata]